MHIYCQFRTNSLPGVFHPQGLRWLHDSNKKHCHLSLYSLHKFPFSPEKWGQITTTMASDPVWKEYIKYIKRKSFNAREMWVSTAVSSITATWTEAVGSVIWGKELNILLFLHTLSKREKRPQNTAGLHWLGGAHVKDKQSSLAPLCGCLTHPKQHGLSLMFKLVKLDKARFLNCK